MKAPLLYLSVTTVSRYKQREAALREVFDFAHLEFTNLLEAGDTLPSDDERMVLWHLTRHFCAWASVPTIHTTNP